MYSKEHEEILDILLDIFLIPNGRVMRTMLKVKEARRIIFSLYIKIKIGI